MVAFGNTPKIIAYGDAESDLVLFVRGHGTLPPGLWYRTRTCVSAIFEKINFRVNWQNGNPPNRTLPGPIGIVIHFVGAQSKAIGAQVPICSSGAACTVPFSSANSSITVMYDRGGAVIRKPASFHVVLAHVIAHEITHVVQVTDRHSDHGIMKAIWTAADVAQIESSGLGFTPQDVEFIRQGFDYRRRLTRVPE